MAAILRFNRHLLVLAAHFRTLTHTGGYALGTSFARILKLMIRPM